MDTNINTPRELSALELNNIKLDIKHTVLTPQYLENLIQNKDKAAGNPEEKSNSQVSGSSPEVRN